MFLVQSLSLLFLIPDVENLTNPNRVDYTIGLGRLRRIKLKHERIAYALPLRAFRVKFAYGEYRIMEIDVSLPQKWKTIERDKARLFVCILSI